MKPPIILPPAYLRALKLSIEVDKRIIAATNSQSASGLKPLILILLSAPPPNGWTPKALMKEMGIPIARRQSLWLMLDKLRQKKLIGYVKEKGKVGRYYPREQLRALVIGTIKK